jgi:adenine-specific DNA-methyltransferase
MKAYKKNNQKIIHGDSIEILKSKLIKDGSIKLIFLDPPYNIGKNFNGMQDKWESDQAYLDWCYIWLDLCLKKLSSDGTMYVMTSTQYMPFFDTFLRKKVDIISRIVWHYDSSGVQAQNYFGSLYEPILHCVKSKKKYTFNASDILIETKTGAKRKLIDYRSKPPKAYNYKKIPGNVWNFSRVRYRMDEYEEHPTQKPTKLLERIIKASSNEGDLILDPFAGTFTTAYVSKQLKRKSISLEMNLDYVKIGLRRLKIQTVYNKKKLTGVQKKNERVNFLKESDRKKLIETESKKHELV